MHSQLQDSIFEKLMGGLLGTLVQDTDGKNGHEPARIIPIHMLDAKIKVYLHQDRFTKALCHPV